MLSVVKIQTAISPSIVKLLTRHVPILAYGILADPMHLEHPEYPSTMFVTANVSPVSPETPKPDAVSLFYLSKLTGVYILSGAAFSY